MQANHRHRNGQPAIGNTGIAGRIRPGHQPVEVVHTARGRGHLGRRGDAVVFLGIDDCGIACIVLMVVQAGMAVRLAGRLRSVRRVIVTAQLFPGHVIRVNE